MSAKKAKKLRKELGMSKKNLTEPEYKEINETTKVVYFKNNLGELVPQQVTRKQVVNRNKNFYRKQKKEKNNG
jgi:hypothetical protein